MRRPDDHGCAHRQLPEAAAVGGDHERLCALGTDAPVGIDGNDRIHGSPSLHRDGDLPRELAVFVALDLEAVAGEGVKIVDGRVDDKLRRGLGLVLDDLLDDRTWRS